VVVGILAGPLVANGINPYSWNDTDEITKQLTRCVIAIQVQWMNEWMTLGRALCLSLLTFKGMIGRSWLLESNYQSKKRQSFFRFLRSHTGTYILTPRTLL
jgi:hypothetical protein